MKKTAENRDVLTLQEISSHLCNMGLGEHPGEYKYISLLKAVASLYYSFHPTETASSSDTEESLTSSSSSTSMSGDEPDDKLIADYSALFPQKLKIPTSDIFLITQLIKNNPTSPENNILSTAWNLFLQANDMNSYELSLDDFFDNFIDETSESKEQLVTTLLNVNKFETEAEFKLACLTLLKCATCLYLKLCADLGLTDDRYHARLESHYGNLFLSNRIILPAALTFTVDLLVCNYLDGEKLKRPNVLKIFKSWSYVRSANHFPDLYSTSLTKSAIAYIGFQERNRRGINYPHKFIEIASEYTMLKFENLTEALPQWLNKISSLFEGIRYDFLNGHYDPETANIVLATFRDILQRMLLPTLGENQETIMGELIQTLDVLTDHRQQEVEMFFSAIVENMADSYDITFDSRNLVSDAIENFLRLKVHSLLSALRNFQGIYGFKNKSQESEMGLALILNYLPKAPYLDSLDLSRRKLNALNETDWQSVCTAFVRMTHLTSLNLSDNDLIKLSGSQWITFCMSIQAAPHLTSLYLAENGFESMDTERRTQFIQAIESHFNFTDIVLLEDEATYTPESFEINQCINKVLSRNVVMSNSKKMAEALLLGIPSYQAELKEGSPLALTQITETTLEMLTSALALLEACTGSEADAYRTRFQQQHDEIAFRVANILSTCNECGTALGYYQEVSPESPNYCEARFNAFLIVVMNYLSDPDYSEVEPKIRARNAVLSALPLCLDAKDQLISFERLSMSDFDGFLLRAVGIPEKDVINTIGSVTKELRLKLFQYLMLIDLKEALFSRQLPQVQTDFFQKERLGGLRDKLQNLPSISSLDDFAQFPITELLLFTRRRLGQVSLAPEVDLYRRFRMAVFPVEKTDSVDHQLDI